MVKCALTEKLRGQVIFTSPPFMELLLNPLLYHHLPNNQEMVTFSANKNWFVMVLDKKKC